MDPKPDEPVLPFTTGEDFERWLARHHATVGSMWIKYAKKGTGEPSITWTEAVDVALCYGWIDGQAKSIDDRHYIQRFTPRRATSVWSTINRDRVARLIESGRMQPAGLAEVTRAKADGRWAAAYDSPSRATVPEDLERALASNRTAKAAFAKLDATNRFAILHRLQLAKQRARLIERFVAMLAAGETLHPRRTPRPAAKRPAAAKAKPTRARARR